VTATVVDWGRCAASGERLPRGVRIALLLAPSLAVVVVLFLGGLGLGVAQSLGYQPFLPGWRWSLDAYRAVWHDPAVRSSFALTLRVALVSTFAATVLGVSGALLVHRLPRGRKVAGFLFGSTLAVPHLVGALTMLLLLGQSGLLSRFAHAAGLTATPAEFPPLTADAFGWGIVAEYTWKEAPFVGVVVLTALGRGIDELTAAASTLGAGPWQRLLHVTAPLITPAVAATSLLVLAFTFGSYEVPALLGQPYPATLPVVALQYQQDVDLNARPQALALATAIAISVSVLTVLYLAVVKRVAGRPRTRAS
jgi:putative spermidine/putrescine transport system permease protein